MTSEASSEPIQTSKMAVSVKIAKGFKHYCFCIFIKWEGGVINKLADGLKRLQPATLDQKMA